MIVKQCNQSSVVFETRYDCTDTIFWVHISPGNAETLVRRGGIANRSQQHFCQKLLKSVDVCWRYGVCYIVSFLRHSVHQNLQT